VGILEPINNGNNGYIYMTPVGRWARAALPGVQNSSSSSSENSMLTSSSKEKSASCGNQFQDYYT
jgi:hypothetical protein